MKKIFTSQILFAISIMLALLLSFAAGWVAAGVHRVMNRALIQAVAEINPSVALIKLKKQSPNYFTGKIEGAPARIFLDDKMMVVDEKGEFTISTRETELQKIKFKIQN